MEEFMTFLGSENAWVLIPIVGIIAGVTLSIVRAQHRHQERLAMIQKGQDPDAPGRTEP